MQKLNMKNIVNSLNYKQNILENIIYFLIVLLPFTLVSGPFLSDLSISIIAILFIYISFKKKLYSYYNNNYSKVFGFFFLILLLTSLFSLNPLISFKKTIFFFRFWIFALALWYIFSKNKDSLCKILITSFSLVFIFLIIDGYIQFFFKENIFGWPIQDSRISSLFKDELILGSYLSRLLPIYFGLLVYIKFGENIFQYILFFLIFIGVETLIFLSGERVAFFYVNASTLLLLLTMNNFKFFRLSTFIISIILIITLVNFYPNASDRIIKKTQKQLGFFQENKKLPLTNLGPKDDKKQKKYVFSIEHHNHYASSLRMFKDNKVTGVGPRMFRFTCGEKKYNIWEGCSTHPHNTYVQLLAEMGLIGFVFGFLIFLFIFFNIFKHFIVKVAYKKIIFNDFQLCLLSAILISIWPFVPTGGLFNNWLNIIYFFPVGFFLSTMYPDKNN